MNSDEGAFDVVVVGTGLAESIAAAALSKAGFKVAHIDRNNHYGDGDASLTVDEFVQHGRKYLDSFECSSDTLPQSRQYSLSLAPSVIPATGPLIASLVSSGVARYGGFRLVERISVYDSARGNLKSVPGNKADIFSSKEFSLVDKRRLMRFLMFASGDFEEAQALEGKQEMPFPEFLRTVFSLNESIVTATVYSLAFCFAENEPTLPALLRLRRYLRSSGRYGASPFLVGQYGSSGEIAQGFCRTSAVSGGVYILGRNITSLTYSADSTPHYKIHLEDFPEEMTSKVLIGKGMRDPVPSANPMDDTFKNYEMLRGVLIVDQPIQFSSAIPETLTEEVEAPSSSPTDLGIITFPPSSVSGGLRTAVTALVVGEGTMSTPSGKWIIYLSAPAIPSTSSALSVSTALTPYVDTVLALTSSSAPIQPLFTAFYRVPPASSSAVVPDAVPGLRPSPIPHLPLPESPDAAAASAEAVFRAAVRELKGDAEEEPSFWPPVDNDEDGEEDE